MTDEKTTPQPQAVPEPTILGELTDEEIQYFQQMRRNAADIVHQIGNMEVQKARMMGNISEIEGHSKAAMEGISERLGLAKGVHWQIQDNKIVQVVMPSQTAPQVVSDEKTTEEAPANNEG
jgi:hypothetical protein